MPYKILFAVSAVVATSGTVVLFELQHIWPFNADRIVHLRLGLLAALLCVIASWMFHPSPARVGLCMTALFTVAQLFSHSAFTGAYAAAATAMIALGVLATHFRRQIANDQPCR